MKITIQKIASLTIVIAAFIVSAPANAQQIAESSLQKNTAPVANSLSLINRLEPVSYRYNLEDFKQFNLPAGEQFGFANNNLKQVLPAAIKRQSYWYTAGKNHQRTVTTAKADVEALVPLLVAAIKEQQAQIELLKQEVQLLKQRN